jgi:hypothetical protein
MSEHVSTVVKRREQSGHWRRLRIDVPSSVVRLSTTRLSGCLQKGQCMDSNPPHSRLNSLVRPHGPLEAATSIGDRSGLVDPGDHNFWATVAIQPLDVGIGLYIQHKPRVGRTEHGGAAREATAHEETAWPPRGEGVGEDGGLVRERGPVPG